MSNIKANQVCLITALIALIIYVYGILVTITSVEKNDCKMTYMFEYPAFSVSSNYMPLLLDFIFIIVIN